MAARQEGDEVIVATDDERIRQAAEAAGADCVLTSSGCANGTERCAAALDGTPGAERFDVNRQPPGGRAPDTALVRAGDHPRAPRGTGH